MNRCKIGNRLCHFALKDGNCSQPSLSSQYLKCGKPKENKKAIIQEIKRHLIGIEKAVEKLEKE
jgi:hypothetical protein